MINNLINFKNVIFFVKVRRESSLFMDMEVELVFYSLGMDKGLYEMETWY